MDKEEKDPNEINVTYGRGKYIRLPKHKSVSYETRQKMKAAALVRQPVTDEAREHMSQTRMKNLNIDYDVFPAIGTPEYEQIIEVMRIRLLKLIAAIERDGLAAHSRPWGRKKKKKKDG